jgi:uncharacterized LabA/DUF88 family protein
MRTIVYIDALNLYYRALKFTPHKWLNIEALARAVLPHTCKIEAINYYTAHVSGRVDRGAPTRQNAYLRALKTLPLVTPYFGNFLTSQVWSGLVPPPEFRPISDTAAVPVPIVARVWKTEEKGSDVNLGVHLVRDAFQKKFDAAAILTNDTDLTEPVRIVAEELKFPIILLSPLSTPAASLVKYATEVRHITPYLGPCQFPNPVIGKNGRQISKPVGW